MNRVVNYRLKQEREQRGWSQARVAEHIGTDAVNISRWERGHATPSPYFREKLCQLFEKNAHDLGFLQTEKPVIEPQPSSPPIPEQPPVEEQGAFSPSRHPRSDEQKILMPDRFSRLLAVLSYLVAWVSSLFIFLLSRRHFVRFHSLQAIFFFASSHLFSLVLLVGMGIIPPAHSNKLLSLAELSLPILLTLLNLFTFIVWLVGMFQAWRGNYYQLPFVGSFCEKIIAQQRSQTPPSLLR